MDVHIYTKNSIPHIIICPHNKNKKKLEYKPITNIGNAPQFLSNISGSDIVFTSGMSGAGDVPKNKESTNLFY